MTELWRAVPGYENWYEVSSIGRVRSLPRTMQTKRGPVIYKGRVLKQQKTPRHYATVGLHVSGEVLNVSVHRMVLLAFIGPPPAPSMDGCHCNGDWYDNRIENLRWDTRKANIADCVKHGTIRRGETHQTAKLLDEDIRRIRDMARARGSKFDIAKVFGIHIGHVAGILNGRKRGSVTDVQ